MLKITILKILIISLIFTFSQNIFAQTTETNCEEIGKILEIIKEGHYNPIDIDDDLSIQLFDNFIQKLDRETLYFTNSSLENLYKHRKQLDDYINNQDCDFLNDFSKYYKERLENASKIIEKLATEQLDFTKKDSIRFFDSDKLEEIFSADENVLQRRWQKSLKYKTLAQIYQEEGAFSEDWSLDLVKEKEKEARKKVIEKAKCDILQILENPYGYENYIKAVFINSLTHLFDPHTTYFSKEELKSFTNSLSKENIGLGIQLSENEQEEVIIHQLVPGGAAWKSNNLHKNDVILDVKVEGKVLGMSCIDASEMENFIQSTSGRKVELKIRKSSGEIKNIVLYKEKLENEENIVQGFILKGEKNIGYIALPGFYTQEGENDVQGCSNDVAKEIIKLKKENIQGLILDLRHNGGGSVQEAVDLAGIFIDVGVMSIDKSRISEKPYLFKDRNRGTIYDDPLIILVNQNSASASEIFASALQDYNRALIVGSPTFGKSSGQIVLPIDENLEFGFIKLTVSKFYRVNGTTHQRLGVQPDIPLPDVLSVLGYREAEYKTSLKNDKILKKIYYTPLEELPIKTLNQKSKERTLKDSNFQGILEFIQNWSNIQGNEILYLTPDSYKKFFDDKLNLYQKIAENSYRPSEILEAQNNQYDKEILEMSKYKKLLNETAIENIQNDIYIEEAYKIINDLININK